MESILFDKKEINISLWLRDVYGIIKDGPLFNDKAPSGGYLRGNEIFSYIDENFDIVKDGIICFVIRGLRDVYFSNKNLLDIETKQHLMTVLSLPLPSFIYNEKYQDYDLDGNVTPFNVIHVPVNTFVNLLNNKQPITVNLSDTGISINLFYESFDFWNEKENRLVEYLEIN